MKHWHRLRDDRGLITLLFALLLPAIIGMQALTVDATRMFVEQHELQNGVDAAALAAATYLPSTDATVLTRAREAAVSYASLNGVAITTADVTFTTDRQPFDRVHVQAHREVPFSFARIFGLSVGVVGSNGVAQVGQLGGMAGVGPWGVEPPAGGLQFGEAYCLKLGSSGGEDCDDAIQGNFRAIDIDAIGENSAHIYRNRIATGSLTTLHVGDIRDVVTGNMNGPTRQGLDDRIGTDTEGFEDVVEELGDEDGGYRVLDWQSPRITILPVVQYNTSTATILGFAVFFIESYSNHGAVVGRFIDTIVPGGQWTPLSGSGNGSAYGTNVVRLIQ